MASPLVSDDSNLRSTVECFNHPKVEATVTLIYVAGKRSREDSVPCLVSRAVHPTD